MPRRAVAAVLVSLSLSTVLLARTCDAQDSTQAPQGVRLQLQYAGQKPGVLVLPIAGTVGDSIRQMLQRDLDYGDRVTIVGATGAVPMAQDAKGAFNYPLYAKLGVAGLVEVSLGSDGASVSLHDVANAKVLEKRSYPLPSPALSPAWRMAVHGIADALEATITGTRGIAQTRIAFVKNGRVYLVDSDGANITPITPPGPLAVSPAWHPSGRYLAYSMMGDRSQIVVRDLQSGSDRALVATPGGLNITPTFTKDGNAVAYAHGLDAGTDIYAANPFDNTPGRQITVGRGSENVSPTYSPDGRRVAYTSGRAGHPEIYVSDADGTNAELLTSYQFGDQSYRSDPDWSPDGRAIAFQSQLNGDFQLMTITLRDGSVKQLTDAGSNEDPSWAPDSRHLLFTSTRTGVKELWVLDTESARLRQLTRIGGAKLGAWSAPLGNR